jgi:cytochrome P450
MELESRYTLLDLLETPEHFDKHFGRYSFGVLTRSTFGFKTKSVDDPFIQEVKDQNSFAHNAFRSDLYISNLAPWVLKLPSWLVSDNVVLLAAFSRMAGFIKTLQDNVKAEISQGKAFDSFQRYFLENQHEYGLSELEGGVVFQVFMFAGTRLPHNVLLEFVLAMMQSLEWQEKMQKEIDSVVGPNRLPEFSDIPNLPTVRAVLKESMRSRTIVGESSVPHKLSQDDFYNGYFFEKGTIVHANFR